MRAKPPTRSWQGECFSLYLLGYNVGGASDISIGFQPFQPLGIPVKRPDGPFAAHQGCTKQTLSLCRRQTEPVQPYLIAMTAAGLPTPRL